MRNPWAMKMEQFTRFTDDERSRLDALVTDKAAPDELAESFEAAGVEVIRA